LKDNPWFTPGWVGAYLVCFFLAFLYFLEPLINHRKHSFDIPNAANTARGTFPVGEALSVISAGNFSGTKLSNQETLRTLLLKLGRPEGKLLVNFWATWCDPCIEEIPSLGTLSEQLRTRSKSSAPLVVTISVDEKSQSVLDFQKKEGKPLPFLVLHDPDGAFSKQLGITKFPETYLIDSEGKTIQKWIGPQDWLSLEILQFLKKSCT